MPGSALLPTSLLGELGGMAKANGSARRSSHSPLASVRWKVTVPFASSATTPLERSQVAGFFSHAEAPWMMP